MTTKQVAITGAGRGIGRAIAEKFLKGGWRVWALVRKEDALAPLKALGEVRFVPFDASDETSVLAAAAALNKDAGTLDALVNNAGVALSAPLHKTSTEDYARLMAINVTAPFLLTRELLPPMVKAGKGRIVNIASTAAKKGFKYTAAYCTSKHALLGLTRALAVEVVTKGVTVNAVSPGWVETDMFTASIDRVAKSTGRSEADARKALEQLTPLGRAVTPKEVAEVVWFLADSPEGAAITGADYAIDGGESV